LDEAVTKYAVQTILLRHYSDQGLMMVLEGDANWEPVYFDSQYVVYLRDWAETAELMERLAVDWQNPQPMPDLPRPAWLPPALLANVFPSVGSNREQLLLGELFLNMGSLEQTLTYFDEAIAVGPVNETVHFYRGVIFRARGEERQAAAVFGALDEDFLKQGAAHIFAANIYRKAGNNLAALNAYRQGIDLGFRSEANYRAVIELALVQDDYTAAITALVELAQVVPQDAGVWNELGLVYLEIGDVDRARRAFEQALVVDGGFEAARVNLEGIGD
jgi:tetratricopeptide (TPR) repeat protein